ncbi:MAG: tetratricopeptide repeat protein [Ignavibacteriales bacterium]|nr:tetratricopeptide repeat protein [Ignavibacteriales bacterium]MBP9119399.1 tetratricopeptide repeat protein [Ignavibacterium sp.]
MNSSTENIIEHVKKVLVNFLSQSDTEEFIKSIQVHAKSFSDLNDKISDLDKEQVNMNFTEGISERVIVDKIITLAERLLLKEKYLDLLLELAQYMIKIGNQSYALEILTDLKNFIGSEEIYRVHNGEANLLVSKIYWAQAQWDDCDFYLNEAYNNFKSAEFDKGYAKCENMFGTLYGEKGEFKKALAHFEAALAYLKKSDDIATQAMILTNLGIIYTIYGDFEKAIWNYKDAIEKFQKLNDKSRIARVYHNLGMLYTRMNEYYLALEHFNNSITLSIENQYLSNCAVSYIGKAYIYTKLKNLPLADAFTDKAMELACKLNDTLSIADIYRIKGIIQSNLNNFELSEEFFESSIRLNDDFESQYNKAESSQELGNLLTEENRKEEAKNHLKSADKVFKSIKKNK